MAGVRVKRLIGLICCGGILFLILWTIDVIIGAIYFSVWYTQFDLKDVHIRNFNVTNSQDLNYDMDILIEARHFSKIRAIEYHSYDVMTFHDDMQLQLGESVIPRFHPHNKTLLLSTTQGANRLPMGNLGPLVQADLNSTGKIALRIVMQGKATTPLFPLLKKYRSRVCDLIVSPSSAVGSQITDRICCLHMPCLTTTTSCKVCGGDDTCCSTICTKESTSCCNPDRVNPRSTRSVCD